MKKFVLCGAFRILHKNIEDEMKKISTYHISEKEGKNIMNKSVVTNKGTVEGIEKGGYVVFKLKEIHMQRHR